MSKQKLFIMGTRRDILIWRVYSHLKGFRRARVAMYYKVSELKNANSDSKLDSLRKYKDYMDLLSTIEEGPYRIRRMKREDFQGSASRFNYFKDGYMEWNEQMSAACYNIVVSSKDIADKVYDCMKQIKSIDDIGDWVHAVLVADIGEDMGTEFVEGVYKILEGLRKADCVKRLIINVKGFPIVDIERMKVSE